MQVYAHCEIVDGVAIVRSVFTTQPPHNNYTFSTGLVDTGTYCPTCVCHWNGTQEEGATDGAIVKG